MFWLVYRYKLQREASHFGVAGHIFSCNRGLRPLLAVTANDIVTRVNPLQTAITSGSSLED